MTVTNLNNTIEILEERIRYLEDTQQHAPVVIAKEENKKVKPVYKTVHAFIDEYVKDMMEHVNQKNLFWCDKWFNHPRTSRTLEVLWLNFEEARRDDNKTGGGRHETAFLTYHFYPLMKPLLGLDGPHGRCSKEKGCVGESRLGKPSNGIPMKERNDPNWTP